MDLGNSAEADQMRTLVAKGYSRLEFRHAHDNEEWMSWSTFAYCVRNDARYAFDDGDTIAEASSHSDQELWTDVIVPGIIDGDIEYQEA